MRHDRTAPTDATVGRVCISAGVDTILCVGGQLQCAFTYCSVALAHEPQALAEKDPALYAEVARGAAAIDLARLTSTSVPPRRHACLSFFLDSPMLFHATCARSVARVYSLSPALARPSVACPSLLALTPRV